MIGDAVAAKTPPAKANAGGRRSGPQSREWRQLFRKQFRKTKMCRFYPLGDCRYGTECPYAHDEEEIERPPDLTKTALCVEFQAGGCTKAAFRCPFAHGAEELRTTEAFVNSQLCKRLPATPGEAADEELPESALQSPEPAAEQERRLPEPHAARQAIPSTAPKLAAPIGDSPASHGHVRGLDGDALPSAASPPSIPLRLWAEPRAPSVGSGASPALPSREPRWALDGGAPRPPPTPKALGAGVLGLSMVTEASPCATTLSAHSEADAQRAAGPASESGEHWARDPAYIVATEAGYRSTSPGRSEAEESSSPSGSRASPVRCWPRTPSSCNSPERSLPDGPEPSVSKAPSPSPRRKARSGATAMALNRHLWNIFGDGDSNACAPIGGTDAFGGAWAGLPPPLQGVATLSLRTLLEEGA